MQTIKHPYEILIRGNHENHVVAAHVIYAVTIVHDDGSIQVVPGQPEPCLAENLADVLDPLIAEPLTQIQAMRDEIQSTIDGLKAELAASKDETQKTIEEGMKSVTYRESEIEKLRQQIQELTQTIIAGTLRIA